MRSGPETKKKSGPDGGEYFEEVRNLESKHSMRF